MSEEASAFILRVNSCFTPAEQIHNASILCRKGSIEAVGGYSAMRYIQGIRTIDLSDCHAIPGLVDTHLHGSGGFAAMEADRHADLGAISRVLAAHGVTSFMLTVLSASPERMLAVSSRLHDLMEPDAPGATPVGIHYEGPFLSIEKRGAQSEKYIRPIDLGEARELIAAGRGLVRMMTFAPELDGSDALVRLLRENGIVASMGHSLADEGCVIRAIDAGAERCTHLYNGTPLLDQRQSGLTSVALTDDRITVELIADGVHVHPRMIDLACRAKPLSRIVGVSDATMGAGLPEGIYHLGEDEVEIRGGRSLRVSDGRLAGSCLTLDVALRNLSRFCSMNPTGVLSCFSLNPALGIGLTDRGQILPGMRADITVVDRDWNVRMTIVNGRIVYDRERDGAGPLPAAIVPGGAPEPSPAG